MTGRAAGQKPSCTTPPKGSETRELLVVGMPFGENHPKHDPPVRPDSTPGAPPLSPMPDYQDPPKASIPGGASRMDFVKVYIGRAVGRRTDGGALPCTTSDGLACCLPAGRSHRR